MRPTLCETTSSPQIFIASNQFAMEQKFDGHRVMTTTINGEVSGYTRKGTPRDLPIAVQEALNMDFTGRDGIWMFDGELIGTKYFMFDVMKIPGKDIQDFPWFQRRRVLDQLEEYFDEDVINISKWSNDPDTKADWFYMMQEAKVEGAIFKELSSPYVGRRTHTWLKYKFTKTADFVVTELDRKGKNQSMTIGLYDTNGELQPIGGCRILPRLLGHVKVGDVVEVQYLYATKDHKPYQPVLVRKRTDKDPAECGFDQMTPTNRSIISMGRPDEH